MAKKVKSNIKKTSVTLDELMDETLGKKGTKNRDKFDKKSRKETKKDLQKVIDGKETLIDVDVITNKDLHGYSYEEMLDKAYGKKGTPTRIAAEKRIKEKAKTILADIKKKEAKEKEAKLLSKIGKKLKGRKSLGEVFIDRAKKFKGIISKVMSDIDKKEAKELKKNQVLFLEFAKEFSKKASRVSAGDKFPSIYINSRDGQFRVDYYLKIRDRKTGKIVPASARINLVTGIMEVSKTAFVKYTIPQRIKVLLSLYAKWVNKNEINKNGKPKKSKQSLDSTKVLIKRKAKTGNENKVRKGKKNPIGQKNSKKRKGVK